MSSQADLISIIAESPLSATTKDFFTKKVEREGATPENIRALNELLQAVQQQAVTELSLNLDPNNPKVKAATAKLEDSLKTASDQYAQTLKRLEAAAERLSTDIQDDLKQLETIVVESAKAEA